MRQFTTIAGNAFMELVRQPVFLLLMTASALFEIFLATPYYFAFGDEPKLVKNSVLAVMLLAGLFGAVLSASASLAREIRAGTALAVLSKPVSRAQFLLAKFFGVAAALTLMTYVNTLAALLTSRMAFDAYGKTDVAALAICSAVFLLGLMSDYFFGRHAQSGSWLASVLYTIIPNWQLFWLADALDTDRTFFVWGYVAKGSVYVVCYAGAALAVATALF